MANEMRDRLIELVKASVYGNIDEGFDGPVLNCENVADYLIKNGVIAPPCKVGDTVYSFCDTFGPILILTYFIETFRIGFLDKDRDYWEWEANSHDPETDEFLDEIDFDLDDIGKTVFLTKEAAEQKLKEMMGEQE